MTRRYRRRLGNRHLPQIHLLRVRLDDEPLALRPEDLAPEPLDLMLEGSDLFALRGDLFVFRAHHRRDIRAYLCPTEGLG